MSAFRTLHTFTILLDKTVEESSTRVEDGKTITTTSTVTKPVPHVIVLKEPSRSEKNDLALFRETTYGYAIRQGLVTKLEMQQKLVKSDSTNPLSEGEDHALTTMTRRLGELANEYMRFDAIKDPAQTEDAKVRKDKVLVEYSSLRQKVEDMYVAYQSVYAHTAEKYTETKMLAWLLLFLTYIKAQPSDSVPTPLFPGADFRAKEERAGEMEEANDALFLEVTKKAPSYWFSYLFGRANKPEDFVRIDEEAARDEEVRAKMEAEGKVADVPKDKGEEPPPAAEPVVTP